MKIRKINKLKNVGILDEKKYTNEFCLFKTEEKDGTPKTIYIIKSLIRGDNGTGKSTLSNIFRSIEEKNRTSEIISNIKNIESNENVEIEIELEDKTILKYDTIQQKWINDENIIVKVFNDDYIKQNINLKDFEENKIDGKIETKDVEISVEKKEYEQSNKKISEIIEEGKGINKKIKEYIEKVNISIKENLDHYCMVESNIENYNEKNDEDVYIKNEVELENCITAFKKLRNADKFNIIKNNNFTNVIDNEVIIRNLEYTEDNTKVSFMNQFLELTIERKNWLDKGMSYIENNKCPFCKNDITNNDFINTYKMYSKSNNKKIEDELLKDKEEIEKIKDKVIQEMKILISKNKEYNDIVEIKEDITDDELKLFYEDLNFLISIINEKLKDVSKKIDQSLLDKFKEKIEIINLLIDKSRKIDEEADKINKTMLNAKKELSDLRNRIKSLNKDNIEYLLREEILNRKKLLKDLSEEKDNNKEKKKKYEKKLEDSDVTIKEMNTWLKFFGMNKYQVNKDFNLIYKEKDISDKMFILSTGEVSALAFSYYLSNLITGLTNEEKKKLVIVIDDPVNSLDYNRIYSFCTAIKIIQKKINQSDMPQLILLTHNMLFFNILVQTNWMKSKNAKVFELYKEQELSSIRETRNYKDSLFIVQLSEIIKYANANVEDITIEKSYIYNDIRSVIENLCYLLNPKYVDSDDKYNTLKELFNIEEDEFIKLDYIINNNSHNEPMLNIEKWFDANILHEACQVIAEMIHEKFNNLYEYCNNFNLLS